MDLAKIASNVITAVGSGKLDAHGIGLAGVGLEKLGVDDFVEGGFFKGDLYLDEGKAIYSQMQFKRYNMLTIGGALLSSETRRANAKSNAMGIKGNMKGDGMQLGGTLVISKGGEKVLLCHKQKNPGDHTNVTEVLKCLDIKLAGEEGEDSKGAMAAVEPTPETNTEEGKKVEDGDHKKVDGVKDEEPTVNSKVQEGKGEAEVSERREADSTEIGNAAEGEISETKTEGDNGEKKDANDENDKKDVEETAKKDEPARDEEAKNEVDTAHQETAEVKESTAKVDANADSVNKDENATEESASKDGGEDDAKKEEAGDKTEGNDEVGNGAKGNEVENSGSKEGDA